MNPDTLKIDAEDTQRDRLLADAGYNVVNLHPSVVELDLMTDSWNELVSPEITARMNVLRDAVDFADGARHVAEVFPFEHFSFVSQGRAAEACFWRTAARKDRQVVQNLLFPTSRHHLVLNRMLPVELPLAQVYARDSGERFRGNLNCDALRDLLRSADAASVGFIYIEAENNAAGGYPVSMANVREVHALAAEHGVTLVLDATRLVENVLMIKRFEAGFADRSLWDVLREFCGHFSAMTCSLAKDFGITRGGLIATNDARLHHRI